MTAKESGSHGPAEDAISAIDALISAHQINKVQIGGFDIDGVLRGKYVSVDKFRSAAGDGFGFCDVIFGWDCADALYDCGKYTGWHTGFPDLQARLDLATFRLVPWEPRTALCLADFYLPDGSPLPICPRQALKSVVVRAEAMGFTPRMSAEYEFFLFEETGDSVAAKDYRGLKAESQGMFCYSLLRASARSELADALMGSLRDFGIELEGLHTETGPGAFEACIRYEGAIAAADMAGLLKYAVKRIAARHGLLATFMAKWNADMPGCGGHIHQSLWHTESGRNAFAAEGKAGSPHGSSDAARHYVAGQQQALPELMPMVCPTVNSYRRLVPGFWAPTTATWGIENRTTALRFIPGGNPRATRVETRIAGADASPHLAMAASLAAGLYGVCAGLEPTAPTVGNAYDDGGAPALPRDLRSASARMRESDVAREWFGDTFVEHFCMTREWECREFDRAVTDWELRRYLEII